MLIINYIIIIIIINNNYYHYNINNYHNYQIMIIIIIHYNKNDNKNVRISIREQSILKESPSGSTKLPATLYFKQNKLPEVKKIIKIHRGC